MEHFYYLCAAVFCAIIIIAGIIWAKTRENEPLQIEDPLFSDASLRCSAIVEDYRYEDAFFSGDPLLSKLHQVSTYDPRLRESDAMDNWFKVNTARFMHDGICLAYIHHYGYLENAFWVNMRELNLKPELDVRFQCLLISVDSDVHLRNFKNLLFHYSQNWELLPEVMAILDTDARFANAKKAYYLARNCPRR